MKPILIALGILMFLLLRPHDLLRDGMIYPGDDYHYLAHATSMAYGEFPSYEKEYLPKDKKSPARPVGPGALAAPFVLAFSVLDRVENRAITTRRTAENLWNSWTAYGFIIASNVYFLIACLLLYRGLRHHTDETNARWSVILMILAQGVALYAFRRPVFSHAYEFFLQAVFVYFLLRQHAGQQPSGYSLKAMAAFGFLAGLLALTRYNDVPFALMWPALLSGFLTGSPDRKAALFKTLAAYGCAAITIVVLFAWPLLATTVTPGSILESSQAAAEIPSIFNNMPGVSKFLPLMRVQSSAYYVERLWHILVGIDWGLLYTAPFLLLGIVGFLLVRHPLRKPLAWLMLPAAINLAIVMQWGTHGGWYGYRYFLISALPIFVLPLALLMGVIPQGKRTWVVPIFAGIAVLPVLSMLCFEGNSSNLTLALTEQYFGRAGWGNNSYQLECWKTLLEPAAFLSAVLQGGPLYVTYLIKVYFQVPVALPAKVMHAYATADLTLMAKVLFLYSLPVIFCWVVGKTTTGRRQPGGAARI